MHINLHDAVAVEGTEPVVQEDVRRCPQNGHRAIPFDGGDGRDGFKRPIKARDQSDLSTSGINAEEVGKLLPSSICEDDDVSIFIHIHRLWRHHSGSRILAILSIDFRLERRRIRDLREDRRVHRDISDEDLVVRRIGRIGEDQPAIGHRAQAPGTRPSRERFLRDLIPRHGETHQKNIGLLPP